MHIKSFLYSWRSDVRCAWNFWKTSAKNHVFGSVLGLNYLSPWRLFVFQTEIHRANLLKHNFCFVILITCSLLCRQDQYAVLHFAYKPLMYLFRSTAERFVTTRGFVAVATDFIGFPWQPVPVIRVVWIHSCLCWGSLFRGRKEENKGVMGRLSLVKSLNIKNDRNLFLETEHPTQTLVFTKTAGRDSRVEVIVIALLACLQLSRFLLVPCPTLSLSNAYAGGRSLRVTNFWKRQGNFLQPIRSTAQMWVVTCQQYVISVLVA